MMKKRRLLVALLMIGIGAGPFGCEAPRDEGVRLFADVHRPEKSVVIFFADGLARPRLEAMLDAGRLPNISKYFVNGGVEVTHAITSIPSLTYPNTVSLLTGLFPGHHGILGNRWFDRSSLKYQDYARASTYRSANYDFSQPTIFEIMRDRFTVNVQCPTRRGATYTIDNWAPTGIDWFFGDYLAIDRRVGEDILQVAKVANDRRRWPTVLLFYFPGVDMVGHRSGSFSKQYAAAVENLDTQISAVINALHSAGIDKTSYFVLLSDHGHVRQKSGDVFDLVDWLKHQCGLHVFQKRIDFEHNAWAFFVLHHFDAVVINGAYRRCVIHLKGPLGWANPARKEDILRVVEGAALNESRGDRTKEDRSTALYAQRGVAMVCVRDGPNRVKVFSRKGSCIIERRVETAAPVSNRCPQRLPQYRLLYPKPDDSATRAASDPLSYLDSTKLAVFVAQGWHGSRQWLAATAASRFPDFVPQIVEMFDSSRAGDIVVFAAKDWSFGGHEPSGHGSVLAEDMLVPLYFSGPGLPAGGRIDHARLVDVMPTVVDLLGEASRLIGIRPIDGVSVASELRAAPRKVTPADAESVKSADKD